MKIKKKMIGQSLCAIIILALLLSISRFQPSNNIVQANPGSIQNHAVIIVGGDKYDQSVFDDGFESAYDALLGCGYTSSSIHYLDVIQTRCGITRDWEASEENVRKAFTDWLEPRSDKNDICVVFVFAHGNDDYHDSFKLNHPDHTSEVIYYANVSDWLTNVKYGRLMIVVDACFSSHCTDDLTGEDRIIIATAELEGYTGIGEFSKFFWPLTVDDNIMNSFNNASQETYEWTILNPIQSGGRQIPKLDDNADGTGHWTSGSPLPTGGDGYLANVTYVDPANMTKLVVEAKGVMSEGGIETLSDVNVTIPSIHLSRNSTMNILLPKNNYTIHIPNVTQIEGVTWYFRNWEDHSANIVREITLSGSETITATYVDSFHNLTIAVVPDSSGTTDPPPGTYTHYHGVNVSVEASETEAHYEFDHWELDGETMGGNPEITVFMNATHDLEAYFEWFNNPTGTPTLTGPSSGEVGVTYDYWARTTDPEGDDVQYQFDWGDNSPYHTTGWYGSGISIKRSHSWGSAATYIVRVRARDNLTESWTGWCGKIVDIGEGSGCPYVYAWNGSDYVIDNNILPNSEISSGSDVEDIYRLEQTVIPYYSGSYISTYSFMLSEFENEHSYVDKVRLYAVDHDPNVNVAVTPDGEILTYSDPNPPMSAIDNYGYDWLASLLVADDMGYRGYPGDYLLLDFGNLDVSQAAKLILRGNIGFKKEVCIHIQVLNETDEWTDVEVLRTRNNMSLIIMDLSQYLPNPDGTLKIRLYLTGMHEIDYAALDTTPNIETTKMKTIAFSAIHSTSGHVAFKLLLNDQLYAELLPGEYMELRFMLPNTTEERTFILEIEGHYETIDG